jgi:hypothetical protein
MVAVIVMTMMIWETYFENCYQTNNYQFHYIIKIIVIYNFRVLNIIHRPRFFYLKHDFSEITFCPRLQLKTYSLGPNR